MEPFEKTNEFDDLFVVSLEYSNGEQTITVDIDGLNYMIECRTEFFIIHCNKFSEEQVKYLDPNLALQVPRLEELDKIADGVALVKEIIQYINDAVVPDVEKKIEEMQVREAQDN